MRGWLRHDDGRREMVYKGLETVRSDWSPLAQQFQQALYLRIFNRQPYQDYVRDFVRSTLAGEHDELLIYRKRLRRQLSDYERNVPPTCGPHGWRISTTTGRGAPASTRTAAPSVT